MGEHNSSLDLHTDAEKLLTNLPQVRNLHLPLNWNLLLTRDLNGDFQDFRRVIGGEIEQYILDILHRQRRIEINHKLSNGRQSKVLQVVVLSLDVCGLFFFLHYQNGMNDRRTPLVEELIVLRAAVDVGAHG